MGKLAVEGILTEKQTYVNYPDLSERADELFKGIAGYDLIVRENISQPQIKTQSAAYPLFYFSESHAKLILQPVIETA